MRSPDSPRNVRRMRRGWTPSPSCWPLPPVCGSVTGPTSERARRIETWPSRLRGLLRRTVRADPHDLQAVGRRREPEFGRATHRSIHRSFGVDIRGEIPDESAGRADDVVMVPRELFRELVPAEAVLRDDAVDDTGVLEDREIPIRRAHGELAPPLEDLVDREWLHGRPKDLEQRTAARGEALADTLEPARNDLVQAASVASRIRHRSPPSDGPPLRRGYPARWSHGPQRGGSRQRRR